MRQRESPEGGGPPEGPRRRLADDAPHAPGRTEGGLEHGAVGGNRAPRAADAGGPREVDRRQPLQHGAEQVRREARVHRARGRIGLGARRIGRGGGVGTPACAVVYGARVHGFERLVLWLALGPRGWSRVTKWEVGGGLERCRRAA